jgi:cytochrome b
MDGEQTNFLMPVGMSLNPNNRWARLAKLVPWSVAETAYQAHFYGRKGGPTPHPVRVALGALIIKERLGLTDRETVEQIRENR